MNPERWQQIERIYNRALELDTGQRAAFIDGACAGDSSLRNEVESLLARQSLAEHFIESPAIEMAAQALARDQQPRTDTDLAGRTLLHYQITGKIGEGGMGVVYRAQDTHLNRPVAIKVLPDVFEEDAERLGRFEREARLLATLNHPNIASIYGLEKLDGKSFLVLELVEGQTLEERLTKGPMPIAEALDICRQIAEGLEAAHDKGVIHRDLKPANVKLTADGKVKILDFGLAKALHEQTDLVDFTAPNADSMTASGVILGTVAYMSPEQAKGKSVDRRTDVWAFGCVLYECLTVRKPFEGETVTETVAAILRDEPDWNALPASTPAKVADLLHKCLRKDSRHRLRDIGDARIEIEEASPPGAPLQRRWIVAAIFCAVVAIAAVLFALNVGSLRDRLLTALDLKSAAPPGIESIVVLPLENLSRDPEQEYFAGGLTDALITDLGKMITMRVISRTSVMQYKGTRKPLPEIARELNVDAAVEGTVQRSGSRVRITAQLLRARTERQLWAETYERDFEDVIRLERQMAVAIAHEVTGRLTPAQETRLARSTTTNPRAYDAYLRGRYLFGQRTPEPTAAAVGYFEQALKEDPHFALAYSGLADCYGVAWYAKGDLPLAEKYARKALELEPDLAEAHASLGIIDIIVRKFADAEKELRRALDLNPNYVMAHHWWSYQLLYFGRLEEALAENERARQLDPFSLPVNHLRVIILIGLRQYDRAIEQAEREAEIDPQLSAPHVLSARIYWVEGRVPDALAEERKAATLLHLPARLRDLDEVAAAFAGSGLRAAQVKSTQLKEKGYKGVYSASEIAFQYGVVEDKGKVLEWLNQAFRDNDDALGQSAKTAPEFDFVRSDPRFHDLLRRLGLEL